MKIINNTDINNLILFSKKNLGMYKLVYIDHKKIYWLSIATVIISVCLLIIYIFFTIFQINIFFEKLCSLCCLFTSLCGLGLLKYIEKQTQEKHLIIQYIRYKLLKKYYSDRNYNNKDIKTINQQLAMRIQKIEKQKITVLVIIGVMILPLWDIFVQFYFDEFSFIKIVKFITFLVIFSLIILVIIRFLNRAIYLYEENFYIKNNIAIIENLIYLNEYIIYKKEENNNNGRRRR
ncbi:MAG: hypothetical protein K2O16_07600 [Lachnospiraceae bacterium]|nr:hypothetical protein [Lachnospiraceae bacterium]